MFKWLSRLWTPGPAAPEFREPVETILRDLRAGRFEISLTLYPFVSSLRIYRDVGTMGECSIGLICNSSLASLSNSPKTYRSYTDEWMTGREVKAVYLCAREIYDQAEKARKIAEDEALNKDRIIRANDRMELLLRQFAEENKNV